MNIENIKYQIVVSRGDTQQAQILSTYNTRKEAETARDALPENERAHARIEAVLSP